MRAVGAVVGERCQGVVERPVTADTASGSLRAEANTSSSIFGQFSRGGAPVLRNLPPVKGCCPRQHIPNVRHMLLAAARCPNASVARCPRKTAQIDHAAGSERTNDRTNVCGECINSSGRAFVPSAAASPGFRRGRTPADARRAFGPAPDALPNRSRGPRRIDREGQGASSRRLGWKTIGLFWRLPTTAC